jgi:hypothetical protein
VSSNACEELVHVVKMLDDLASEDSCKCPSQIEVLGIRQVDTEPRSLQARNYAFVTVNADEIRYILAKECGVQSSRLPLLLDAQPPRDQRPHRLESITQRVASPRSLPSDRLREAARRMPLSLLCQLIHSVLENDDCGVDLLDLAVPNRPHLFGEW